MSDVQFHDAAAIFPLMVDDDFDALVNDLRQHGLQTPVDLLEEKIIDGRNRYRACLQAGVKPIFNKVNPDDPVQFVMSRNLHRRHLTPSQLALVAGKARDYYAKAAKERQRGGKGGKLLMEQVPQAKGTARDKAGKAVGVSGKLVDRATKVIEKGAPELAKAVEEGRMSVSKAAEVADLPEAEQKKVADGSKFTGGRYRDKSKKKDDAEPDRANYKGKAIIYANEAIDALKRIPKNDPLRKRGFQIVTDWIKANK